MIASAALASADTTVGEGCGSISKERLKGQAPSSHGTKYGFSVSSLEVERMYPAVAKLKIKGSSTATDIHSYA